MEGGISWAGVSGVPGLGCSVHSYAKYTSMWKLWEQDNEALENENNKKKKTFRDKIGRILNIRRKQTELEPVCLSLPKVSIKRSMSAVSSNRRKTQQVECEHSKNSGSQISRSVSLHRGSKKEMARDQQFLARCEYIETPSAVNRCQVRDVYPLLIRNQKYDHQTLIRTSSTLDHQFTIKPLTKPYKDRQDASRKCQATQTDILEECQATHTDILEEVTDEQEYDYVYSDLLNPAMTIKHCANLDEKDKEDTNIYEEIVVGDRVLNKKMTHTHNRILISSEEELEKYRFAGWDVDRRVHSGEMINKIEKDNYIKQQDIKKDLKENILLNKKKTKENKNVTFSIDDKKLQRSKSVNGRPGRFSHSYL